MQTATNQNTCFNSMHYERSNARTADCFSGKKEKPLGDQKTFKLLLFYLGNVCTLNLICKWILLSHSWQPDEAKTKRAQQVDLVLNNVDGKRDAWLYSDVYCRQVASLVWSPQEKVTLLGRLHRSSGLVLQAVMSNTHELTPVSVE